MGQHTSITCFAGGVLATFVIRSHMFLRSCGRRRRSCELDHVRRSRGDSIACNLHYPVQSNALTADSVIPYDKLFK